ncbi:MAG: hypothetical protein AB7K71_11810 [Polyangiaceae bacterium]
MSLLPYAEVFESLFARAPVGVGASVLEAAETRLGCVLPKALREFYAGVGGEKRVTATHNTFLAPDELFIADGRIVFCDENQSVCVWGIEANSDDPEVHQGVTLRHGYEWHGEELSCSQFMRLMIHLQAAWGGYEHAAQHWEPAGVLPRIEGTWTQVVDHNGLRVFQLGHSLISELEGSGFLSGAALCESGLQLLCDELGFDIQ